MIKHLFIAIMGLSLVLGGFNVSLAKDSKGSSNSTKAPKNSTGKSEKDSSSSTSSSGDSTDSSTTSCSCGGGGESGGSIPDYDNEAPVSEEPPAPSTPAGERGGQGYDNPPYDNEDNPSDLVSGCGTTEGSAPDVISPPDPIDPGPPPVWNMSCEETAFSKYQRCLDNGGARRICKKKLLHNLTRCE